MLTKKKKKKKNLLPIFPHVISLRIAAMEGDETGVAGVLQRRRRGVLVGGHVGCLIEVVGNGGFSLVVG
jgi:hypothetical protein